MRISLHPEARVELLEAHKWYYERSPLSAVAFSHAIDSAISKIVKDPTQFPLADHTTRKFVLDRFPFNIFYLSHVSKVIIVAVAHQKRRPGYWSDRVIPP